MMEKKILRHGRPRKRWETTTRAEFLWMFSGNFHLLYLADIHKVVVLSTDCFSVCGSVHEHFRGKSSSLSGKTMILPENWYRSFQGCFEEYFPFPKEWYVSSFQGIQEGCPQVSWSSREMDAQNDGLGKVPSWELTGYKVLFWRCFPSSATFLLTH